MRCRAVRYGGGALVDNGEYSRRFAAAWNRVRRRVRVGAAVGKRVFDGAAPRVSAPMTGDSIPHVWISQSQVTGSALGCDIHRPRRSHRGARERRIACALWISDRSSSTLRTCRSAPASRRLWTNRCRRAACGQPCCAHGFANSAVATTRTSCGQVRTSSSPTSAQQAFRRDPLVRRYLWTKRARRWFARFGDHARGGTIRSRGRRTGSLVHASSQQTHPASPPRREPRRRACGQASTASVSTTRESCRWTTTNSSALSHHDVSSMVRMRRAAAQATRRTRSHQHLWISMAGDANASTYPAMSRGPSLARSPHQRHCRSMRPVDKARFADPSIATALRPERWHRHDTAARVAAPVDNARSARPRCNTAVDRQTATPGSHRPRAAKPAPHRQGRAHAPRSRPRCGQIPQPPRRFARTAAITVTTDSDKCPLHPAMDCSSTRRIRRPIAAAAGCKALWTSLVISLRAGITKPTKFRCFSRFFGEAGIGVDNCSRYTLCCGRPVAYPGPNAHETGIGFCGGCVLAGAAWGSA